LRINALAQPKQPLNKSHGQKRIDEIKRITQQLIDQKHQALRMSNIDVMDEKQLKA